LDFRLIFGFAVCMPLWKPNDGTPGNSIFEKFWSLHCRCWGARSHVFRGGKKLAGHRRAAEAQVHKHGWWRCQRSGEKIDVMRCKWLIRDHIKIALCSMQHGFTGLFSVLDSFMVAEMVWCV
jgi:hypothetical protein